jgi:HEPN domain-containing protein
MNNETKSYFDQWIEKADEDCMVVRQLFEADSIAKGAIGFHCQQATEKFLKAFLIFNDIDPIRTHNIEFLLELCSTVDKEFSLVDAGNLTDFGVEARYPGDFLEPSIAEIQVLIQIMNLIREMVLQKTC